MFHVENFRDVALNNSDFRRILSTTPNAQVGVMSLKPGEEIGKESHPVDQTFWVAAGAGTAIVAGEAERIKKGAFVHVPANTEHNISASWAHGGLKLVTIYAPSYHKPGTVHHTKADAESDPSEQENHPRQTGREPKRHYHSANEEESGTLLVHNDDDDSSSSSDAEGGEWCRPS